MNTTSNCAIADSSPRLSSVHASASLGSAKKLQVSFLTGSEQNSGRDGREKGNSCIFHNYFFCRCKQPEICDDNSSKEKKENT